MKGNTTISGNSSASGSGPLTASEWAAIVSSLAFVTLWLGIHLPDARFPQRLSGTAREPQHTYDLRCGFIQQAGDGGLLESDVRQMHRLACR